jgi:hypothetical protein
MTAYVPAIVLCAVPLAALQWLALAAAAADAFVFCWKALTPALEEAERQATPVGQDGAVAEPTQPRDSSSLFARMLGGTVAARSLLVAVACVHVVNLLLVKLYFF